MPKFDTKTDFDIFSVIKDEDLNVESNLIKDQIENDVKSLLKELPDDQREVLEMRIYNEYSFKEIAYKTDVSINTALGRMRYALINLRKIIEERNIILTEK
jgi:RNA polymerase sigma-70 factor (ECF subfamily)